MAGQIASEDHKTRQRVRVNDALFRGWDWIRYFTVKVTAFDKAIDTDGDLEPGSFLPEIYGGPKAEDRTALSPMLQHIDKGQVKNGLMGVTAHYIEVEVTKVALSA